jgi:hypothetical protein
MPSYSRRTPRPRRPRRSAVGTLARFLAIMFFIAGCYLYVGIFHREFLGCDLVFAFAFAISSFYRHTPRIVMSCVCVPGSSETTTLVASYFLHAVVKLLFYV